MLITAERDGVAQFWRYHRDQQVENPLWVDYETFWRPILRTGTRMRGQEDAEKDNLVESQQCPIKIEKKMENDLKNMFYYRKNSEIIGKILKIHDFEIKHDFE